MNLRTGIWRLGLVLVLWLTACSRGSGTLPSGRLLVWHTWNEAEAPIIEQLLADFERLHPGVHLTVVRKPYDTALEAFAQDAQAGLGPDVLIGLESVYARLLYEHGLVADLSASEVDWQLFDPRALQSVQVEDARVGAPLNAYVHVLFYNRALLPAPPASLDEVQRLAGQGVNIGIPTTFFASYWGITALGGSVLDGDGLGEASTPAIARWLTWLAAFRQTPGAVLSPDMRALVEGFAQGKMAALVANSLDLAYLEAQLGAENLAVATLPGYPVAQPFANVEVMVVNSASTQTQAAAALINFLSNETQQRKLARSTAGRAPVNRRVSQLNPTLYPRVSVVLEQARAAVVPTAAQDQVLNRLIPVADPIYQQVLEGILSPDEGAQQIVDALKQKENGP